MTIKFQNYGDRVLWKIESENIKPNDMLSKLYRAYVYIIKCLEGVL